MIAPRVLFQGDLAEAVKYVGIAKKLATSTFAAGILSKVWKISDGVSIRVVNNLQSNICKVWIEAARTGGGYQFYTTSPTPQWATWTKPDTDFFPGGSGVYVPYPAVKIVDGVADFSQAKIKAYPTGSTVEVPPVIAGRELWRYWSMPDDLGGLHEIMSKSLLKVKGSWQVNGFPEGVYFSKVLTQAEIDAGLVQQAPHSLFHAYVQGGGQVHGCGAFQPISYTYFTDFRYDVAPAKMKPGTTKLNGKAPDTDWFGKAGLCSIVSEEYGARLFVIASAFDGVWHCYPVNAGQDLDAYTTQYAMYGDQAYKSSVIPEQAKSVTPAYPGWVSSPISWRDSYLADAEKKIFEPCYSWSFSQNGRKAISVMVERKDSESTCAKIEYYLENKAKEFFDAYHYAPNAPMVSPLLPTGVEIDSLEVDPSAREDGTSDPKKIQIDRRGCVELEFLVGITGPELGDFTFDIAVTTAYSPDILDALGIGALVEIAYAMPLNWTIEETQSFGKSITNQPFRTVDVVADDILSVWTELYRHENQEGLIDLYDGEMSLNVPSKSKARFYKGFPGSGLTELFCIPLSQAHGIGYTHSDDPDVLPEPAHLFVRNTDRSFASMFPWKPEEGESEELYYYSTRITALDLRSLSFYCTVRLLEQRRGEPDESGHWCAIINKAKKYCAVCVMGKVIDEYEVGSSDLPTSWIKGWLRSAGSADLDEGESLTPVDFTHNLRGIGMQARNEGFPVSSGGAGPEVPFIFFSADPFYDYNGKPISWINLRSYSSSPEYDSVGLPIIGESPGSPWWAIGPCAHVIGTALHHSYISCFLSSPIVSGESYPTGQYETGELAFSPIYPLIAVGDDLSGFLSYLYDFYSSLNTHASKHGAYLDEDSSLISYSVDYGEHNVLGYLYSANPLEKANPRLTKSEFISKLNSPYFKKIIDTIRRQYISNNLPVYSVEGSVGYALNDDSDVEVMFTSAALNIHRSFFVLPRGSGLIKGSGGRPGPNYNSFTEFVGDGDFEKSYKNGYTVYDLELGPIYYNTSIMNHFTYDEVEFTSNILVTPEGHISYCKKNLYEIKTEFCSQKVWYENFYYDEAMYGLTRIPNQEHDNNHFSDYYDVEYGALPESDDKLPKYYRNEKITDEIDLSENDIDWKSVDGLSWYYGNIKTKHLYLYNLAYQTNTGDERKKFLQSNEEFLETYTEEMFKPDFRVSVYSKFRWIYPYKLDDGQPITLDNLACTIGDSPHFTAVSPYPKHDPRPKKTFLRLSPLFF